MGGDAFLVTVFSGMFINPSFAFACVANVLSTQIIRTSCEQAGRDLPIVVQKLAKTILAPGSRTWVRRSFTVLLRNKRTAVFGNRCVARLIERTDHFYNE